MPHALIIVMPVYEDRKSARQLLKDLAEGKTVAPFIVAVEDGSVRDPLQPEDISEAGLDGEVLYLARNMGHQRAIATGIAHVAMNHEPETVIVMDSDGEDVPQAVPGLISELAAGPYDAVMAQRRKRSESFKFRAFYAVYKLLFQILTGRAIGFGNFSALTGAGVKRLAAMQELWVHYAASIMTSRLRVGAVPTDRGHRYAGTPHMNFVALTLHGMRSIMVFAEDVLVRVGLSCVAMAVAAVSLIGAATMLKLVGFATPGWFSTASGILIIIVLQAGILTFVTLMVAGLVKSSPPITRAHLDQLIARVGRTRTQAEAAPDTAADADRRHAVVPHAVAAE